MKEDKGKAHYRILANKYRINVLYLHFAITKVTTNLNEDHHCMLNLLGKKRGWGSTLFT